MKNKEQAIEIIRNDCKIRMHYNNTKGETCAIGALAQAIGCPLPPPTDYTEEQLDDCKYGKDDPNITSINTGYIHTPECGGKFPVIENMREAIQKHFGLSLVEMRAIQIRNDEHETIAERQDAIIEYLNSL